jgi:hypothetical protein
MSAADPAQQPRQPGPPSRPAPAARRGTFGNWLLVLLLGGAFVTAVYLVLLWGAAAGRGMPAYSVYSEGPDGLAQAAAVLGKLGFEPVALTRPVQQTRARGLLIVAGPRRHGPFGDEAGVSKNDARALLKWVAKGNTLLLAGREPTGLHEALRVALPEAKDEARDDTPQAVTQVELSGYTRGVEGLEVEGRPRVSGPPEAVPLWWVGDAPGALLVPHGKGRVLVLPDPSPLTHRGLRRADNVLLLYNVAALAVEGGRVYFDEYHHGIRSGGGAWGYLRYHHQYGLLLQLLAVGAVAAWAVAVRLGPARPTPEGRAADAVDYASAVARIYQRAGVRHLLADLLARDFLERLTALLRLRRLAAPAEIVAAWRKRHPESEARARLEELLRGAGELRAAARRQERVAEAELLRWARAFDAFINEYRKAV